MVVSSETARYCYLDLDLRRHRSKLALAAAFVDATDSRYGFSTKDILALGGSELARIPDLLSTDHEWSTKYTKDAMEVRPPDAGNRIVVRLDWETAPLACENFATLCDNGSIPAGKTKASPAPMGSSGKPLTYRSCSVHRVVPAQFMQGGDLVFGNGSGGESIYTKKFKDERAGLLVKHDKRGILSMGNSGKNSNSSQWFITFQAVPQCDGKHVVFGQVVSGWNVLDAIEALGSASGEPVDGTAETCRITDCGLWPSPWIQPGAGYWLDAPDSESYTGVSSVFVVRPRVAVVAPSTAVCDTFQRALRPHCVVTPVPLTDTVVTDIDRLLHDFAIDGVLVAPSCTHALASLELPSTWIDADVPLSHVVLEAKPVDALETVHQKSWFAHKSNWKLDGQ